MQITHGLVDATQHYMFYRNHMVYGFMTQPIKTIHFIVKHVHDQSTFKCFFVV